MSTKKVKLLSADKQEFEVEMNVAKMSELIKNNVEGICRKCLLCFL